MPTDITIDTGTNELLCVVRDRVAIITLNRPEARNALSDKLSPALRRMMGHQDVEPVRVPGRLEVPLSKAPGLVHYVRASATYRDGELRGLAGAGQRAGPRQFTASGAPFCQKVCGGDRDRRAGGGADGSRRDRAEGPQGDSRGAAGPELRLRIRTPGLQ